MRLTQLPTVPVLTHLSQVSGGSEHKPDNHPCRRLLIISALRQFQHLQRRPTNVVWVLVRSHDRLRTAMGVLLRVIHLIPGQTIRKTWKEFYVSEESVVGNGATSVAQWWRFWRDAITSLAVARRSFAIAVECLGSQDLVIVE
ncbi:hypothetical protein FRC17_008574, partial [Serendipita sp. 399]